MRPKTQDPQWRVGADVETQTAHGRWFWRDSTFCLAVLAGERLFGRRFVPQLPGRAAAGVQILQLLTVLKGVHGRPEAIVLERHKTTLAHQPLKRFAHELLAVADIVKNLPLHDEIPAVDA